MGKVLQEQENRKMSRKSMTETGKTGDEQETYGRNRTKERWIGDVSCIDTF